MIKIKPVHLVLGQVAWIEPIDPQIIQCQYRDNSPIVVSYCHIPIISYPDLAVYPHIPHYTPTSIGFFTLLIKILQQPSKSLCKPEHYWKIHRVSWETEGEKQFWG